MNNESIAINSTQRRKQVVIRLPEWVWRETKAAAALQGMRLNAFLADALIAHLKLKPQEEPGE